MKELTPEQLEKNRRIKQTAMTPGWRDLENFIRSGRESAREQLEKSGDMNQVCRCQGVVKAYNTLLARVERARMTDSGERRADDG